MGKVQRITEFDSITSEIRDSSPNDMAFMAHFDVTRSGNLTPNRTFTAITDSGEKIVKFAYGISLTAGATLYVYGLGADGSGKPKIFELVAGASTWNTTATFTRGTKNDQVLFIYKDILYGWQNGDALWSLQLNNASKTEQVATLSASYTTVAQPVHHKQDDIAYFFYDNKVSKLNNATPTADVLTLPSNMRIAGGASYGVYLGIACSPTNPGSQNSVLYIWDRDSSLTTISDKVDLGIGDIIYVGESEDGGIYLVQEIKAKEGGLGQYNNVLRVSYYKGTLQTIDIPYGSPVDYFSNITMSTFSTTSGTYGRTVPLANATVYKDIFYFPAKMTTRIDNQTYQVICSIRRTSEGLKFTIDQDITAYGTVTNNINGIFNLTGYWFVSYDTASKTIFTRVSNLFPTAKYESVIFNGGDASIDKKLDRFSVTTSPMPVDGSVIVGYRKDAETTFTTFLTIPTSSTGTIKRTTPVVESSGAPLPVFKEIQFKIQSIGGAEITGYKFAFTELSESLT